MDIRQREIVRLTAELAALPPALLAENTWNDYTLRLAALAFELSSEAVMVTDRQGTILLVNPAFTAVTGYTQTEAFGKTPRILYSGRHGPDFYARMWADIHDTGRWVGEIWNRRKDGVVYLEHLTITAVMDQSGKHAYYLGVFRDITERKRYEELIRYHAYHDPLTGLPNRLSFEERFSKELARALHQGSGLAVLFIDLDQFKLVNDTLGHAAGDELLKRVAERLKSALAPGETVSRLGGDEFNVLLPDIPSVEYAAAVSRKLIGELTRPYRVYGRELQVGASIGISLFPRDGEDIVTLCRKADDAMYRAKESGGNAWCFYEREAGGTVSPPGEDGLIPLQAFPRSCSAQKQSPKSK